MVSDSILISIKPEYVEKIFNGEKKWEYRRKTPNTDVKKMVIYATAPVSAVVGEAEIKSIFLARAATLWEHTRQEAGIDSQTFYRYFHGRLAIAKAIKLGSVTRYPEPVPLERYGFERPPQSWAYINKKMRNNADG